MDDDEPSYTHEQELANLLRHRSGSRPLRSVAASLIPGTALQRVAREVPRPSASASCLRELMPSLV